MKRQQEFKHTFNLALPLVITLLAQVAMMTVDTLMMGFLGPRALAAGALSVAIFDTLFVSGLGFTIAVGATLASAHGANNNDAITHTSRQGFWLCLFIAIPCWLILWFSPEIMTLLGQPTVVVSAAQHYLHAMMWCFLPSLFFINLRELTAAVGKPRIIMIIACSAIPFNAFFDYSLMLGKFGFPELGIAGIGWATTLVELLMFISIALCVQFQNKFAGYRIFHQWVWPNKAILKEVTKLGWPISASILFEVGLFSVTSFLMGLVGVVPLAAHQIAFQCTVTMFMIPLGISQAATLRVGTQLGAGNKLAAHNAYRTALALGLTAAVITALLFFTAAGPIVHLFIRPDDLKNHYVAQTAITFLHIAAVFQIADAFQAITNGALRGMKDTFIPMLLGLGTYWLAGLGSGIALAFFFHFGGYGLWWGLVIGIIASAVALFIRYRYQHKAQAI